MTPDEFASALINIEYELESTREERTRKMIQDAVDAVAKRVINQGIDAQGSPFSPYSTNPLPSFFFLTGKLGKKKTTKMDENKAVKEFVKQYGRETSYFNWREFHGLPTQMKNYTMTGEMWKSVIITVIDIGPEEVVWGVTSSDPANLTVLLIHHQKDGIMYLNGAEIDKVLLANQDRITDIITTELDAYA